MIPLFTEYHDGQRHYIPSALVAQKLGVTLKDLRHAARRTTPPITRKSYTQWIHWPFGSPDRGIQIEEGKLDGATYRHIFPVKRWGKGTRRIQTAPLFEMWIEEP